MSDWQERITRETAPAIRVEHELRYRAAAPLIASSDAWADLGCGNGLAAAAALGDARPAQAVLVDLAPEVVACAAGELGLGDAQQLAGDLTDPDDLRRIAQTLLSVQGEVVVTCFEVVEHLDTFLPLLEWSRALAHEHAATFVISVPNDAFWSIRNPHHRTAWGEGAFEELRRLLPAEQTLLWQVALAGSAFMGWDTAPERHDLTAQVGGDGTIATHFIAAFGPRHSQLARSALAVQTDMIEQRRWERQRENDIALMQKVAREHETEIIEQREELRERTVWFDEWRNYIHELERELGRPLSGAAPDELPERAQPGGAEGPPSGQPTAEAPVGEPVSSTPSERAEPSA